MSLTQLTIFGAGLIGGSLALSARKHGLASRIVAVDIRPQPATTSTPFDEWVEATDAEGVRAALSNSTLTVLCVPVRTIIKLLPEVLSQTPGWVTDCGSTKAAIAGSLKSNPDRARFIASHPMAGRPQGGLENASADLFQGRKWILCPEGSSPEGTAALRAFIEGIGAEAIDLSAEEHDRSVAITSHVPQVVARALSVHAVEGDALRAAGPGFASATRVAGGAEAMWRDIFDTNSSAIGDALVDVGRKLQALGEELQKSEVEGTLETLEKARNLRDEPQ
jgi:prephenate dehydrogenase